MGNAPATLDFSRIAAFAGDDAELASDLLGLFLHNAGRYAQDLVLLAQTTPFSPDQWRQEIHKLKGAARTVGALQLAQLAESGEDAEGDAAAMVAAAVVRELDFVSEAARRQGVIS